MWVIANNMSASSLILLLEWNSMEFFTSIIVCFSSRICFILFYGFSIFVELIILFMFCFPNFVFLICIYICSLVAHWAVLRWLFWILCQIFFRFSYWCFILFLCWCYVFLIICDPCAHLGVSLAPDPWKQTSSWVHGGHSGILLGGLTALDHGGRLQGLAPIKAGLESGTWGAGCVA